MSVHTINQFSHVETSGDIVAQGGLMAKDKLYIADMVLRREGAGVRCYVLKDKIPEQLVDNPPTHLNGSMSCEDYYYYARRKGLAKTISDVFPEHNFSADFDDRYGKMKLRYSIT